MKTPVHFDLWYSSTWNDITTDVLCTDEHQPTISGAQQNWLSRVSPTKCDLSIINTTIRAGDDPSKIGKYSPRNAESPLYGLIGRNTPLRVWIRWLADDFARTVASGWGTSASHLDSAGKETAVVGSSVWTTTAGSGSSAVGSGVATHTINAANVARLSYVASGGNIRDAEVRVVVTADEANIDGGSIEPGNLVLRLLDTSNYYYANVLVTTAEVVQVGIRKVVAGVDSEVVAPVTVTGLTYTGQQLAVAFLADGPHLAAKVWAASSGEPFAWQVTATDTSLTAAGAPGVQSGVASGNTDVPVIFTYDSFEVRSYRFTGEVEAWPQEWTLNADDDGNGVVWAPLTAYGLMYRLGLPGQDVLAQSALRRFYDQQTSPAPIAYWPLEEPTGATSAQSGLDGGQPLSYVGTSVRPGITDGAPAGAVSGTSAVGGIGSNVASGLLGDPGVGSVSELVVDFWLASNPVRDAAAEDSTGGVVTVVMFAAGSVPETNEIRITVDTEAGDGLVAVYLADSDTADTVEATGLADLHDGKPHHIRVVFDEDGADTDLTIIVDGSTVGTGTVASTTIPALDTLRLPSIVTWRNVSTDGPGQSATFSHFAIWNDATAPSPYVAGTGHAGETADDRVTRVCEEEEIQAFVYPDSGELLGAQPIAPPLEMFIGAGEAREADGGVFGEPRHSLGFSFRTQASLYNQDPTVTLDYAAAEVAPPLFHREDLDHAQNDIIVTRRGGASSSRVLKETGTLNVSAPHTDPDGVGHYPVRPELSLSDDSRVQQQADWRRWLGTTDELRFAAVGADLTALYRQGKTGLIGDMLGVDPGDKILIENLPAWLGGGDTAQIQRGFTEILGPFHWTLENVTGPAGPYDIGTYETSTNDKRYDTLLTTTAEALDTTETGVDITNAGGVQWGTVTPYNWVIGGEEVTVTNMSGTGASQTATVTRSVNGVVKSHDSGVQVRLAQQHRATYGL